MFSNSYFFCGNKIEEIEIIEFYILNDSLTNNYFAFEKFKNLSISIKQLEMRNAKINSSHNEKNYVIALKNQKK